MCKYAIFTHTQTHTQYLKIIKLTQVSLLLLLLLLVVIVVTAAAAVVVALSNSSY